MRQVIYNFDRGDFLNQEYSDEAIKSLLARATFWAYETYDMVNVYMNRKDMLMVFSQSQGEHKYTIGAVYDRVGGKFSYHS